MKTLLSILAALFAGAAQAHESLAPHKHPHGVSMLPDAGTIVLAVIVLAAGIIAFVKFARR